MARGDDRRSGRHAATAADLVVVEGVMGLFDGVAGPARPRAADGRHGGAAGLAGRAGARCRGARPRRLPPSRRAARTIATMSRIAGVILNRVASPRHAALIAPGFARIGIPLFGAMTEDAHFTLPERHLGLVQASETADLDRRLDSARRPDRSLGRSRRRPSQCGGDGFCRQPPERASIRPASASRLPRIALSPSCIRICSIAGARPGRRSWPSRRSPTRRPMPGRCGVAARRLSRASCRNIGGGASFSPGAAPAGGPRRSHSRRVRWLHGAGTGNRGCRRAAPCHDGPLAPRDIVRPAQDASRLPPRTS